MQQFVLCILWYTAVPILQAAEYVQVPGRTVASAEILALLDLQPLAVAGHVSG